MTKIKADLRDLEKELWLRMRESGILVWETKDGKLIDIKKMSDEHLVNTINMLRRANSNKKDAVDNWFKFLDMGVDVEF